MRAAITEGSYTVLTYKDAAGGSTALTSAQFSAYGVSGTPENGYASVALPREARRRTRRSVVYTESRDAESTD